MTYGLFKNSDLAWKSRKHSDGTMYDGMFIAGIDTPEGQDTYHCENDLWDLFNVKELEHAPEWDGHKPKDIVRLLSLNNKNKITTNTKFINNRFNRRY